MMSFVSVTGTPSYKGTITEAARVSARSTWIWAVSVELLKAVAAPLLRVETLLPAAPEV